MFARGLTDAAPIAVVQQFEKPVLDECHMSRAVELKPLRQPCRATHRSGFTLAREAQ